MSQSQTINGNRKADCNSDTKASMDGNRAADRNSDTKANMDVNSPIRFNPVKRMNEEIRQESLSGERALYRGENLKIYDTVFHDGESPLKESRQIELYNCEFQWKYPLWYSEDVKVKDCVWQEMGRSGVWYTKHLLVEDSMIGAPKNFRRCFDVTLRNTSLINAAETFWNCDGVRLEHVVARGDYFGMNSSHIYADGLELYGNYAFDGGRDIEIHHSKLLTKDCFWNCENITVYDSYISGEYLAWNSRNITLINCTIESTQGLDYIEGLKLVNCKLVNTSYAFEYAYDMDCEVTTRVDSILNPGSGIIRVKGLGEKIIEPDNCREEQTKVIISD